MNLLRGNQLNEKDEPCLLRITDFQENHKEHLSSYVTFVVISPPVFMKHRSRGVVVLVRDGEWVGLL